MLNTITIETTKPLSNNRILFIDLVRAFAILMMLQGHFISTLLAPEFMDRENAVYATWSFMRGLTAPVFFFFSGVIFVFLLLRDQRSWRQNERVKKGLKRGIQLIFIGYLLRLNLMMVLDFKLNQSFWGVDVLHCIGLSLLGLVGLYILMENVKNYYPWLLLLFGLLAFYFSPNLDSVDWSVWPRPLANYFTRQFGSVFTPIPWMGYSFLGGALGAVLNRFPTMAFRWWFPLIFLVAGYGLHAYSSSWFVQFYRWTGWENWPLIYNNNYLFIRLGHVFIALAFFSTLTLIFKKIPPLILRIGSETLLIYEVHFVLLYGSWFGLGLAQVWRGQLNPWQAAFGAALFLVFFILLIAKVDIVLPFVKKTIPAYLYANYRWARVWAIRTYFRLVYGPSKRLRA